MAIDSVSPVMSASPLTSLSRPPETTPDARETAAQENDARRTAESVSGAAPAVQAGPENNAAPAETRVPVVATPDTEGSLREAASQIARASSAGPDSSAALRNASEAYQSEAAAQDALARQQQNNGATSIDMMA